MNISIDAGNTLTKIGIFEGPVLKDNVIIDSPEKVHQFLTEHHAENIIISSVKGNTEALLSQSVVTGRKIIFHPQLPLPIRNFYATPLTLGADRLAAACGARFYFPTNNLLVIDAGTCINYEFITDNGHYLGGAISPGINMRFKAMHHYTENLPEATAIQEIPLTGNTTMTCLQSGVMNGAIEEIRGVIQRYALEHHDLRVILCGGDAHFFENHLNPSIFVAPELVLTGLNSILLHNVA